MAKTNKSLQMRLRRKATIRKRIRGTAERPRLVVFRSNLHTYAQVVDDSALEGNGRTLLRVSTQSKDVKDELSGLKKVEQAKKVGELAAKRCIEQGISSVVFDRNGFLYHGRVAAVADGAREGGLSV